MTKYPEGFSDPKIEAFLTGFYKLSDTVGEDAAYVAKYSADAKLIMGLKVAEGSEQIAELRKGMWGAVVGRHHVLLQVFPFQPAKSRTGEFALVGTVDYTLHNGKKVLVEWGAKMVVDRGSAESDDVKITFYQVYVDSTPVAKALSS
ncbi:hypothetical protein BZA70DRAFT_280250 [Myxozyma melibiosi]|uniref:SnoaL-like domain-containing protein n=1 Tax=Myxozyma melibiosi TaxID=54550 RepID=A0ABR1F4W2_9ASCO